VSAASPQPLWALIPAAGRARYLQRTATAILDELEDLAGVLADTVGQPRTEAVLAELLPSVGGLHDLAEHGPRALRDRRLGRIPALRAGRRSLLVSAPRGTVGVRGGRSSPWAEPVLETAAALLAGNAVVLSTPMGDRVRGAFERGGVPLELISLVGLDEDLSALADHVVDTRPARGKGTMLVLDMAQGSQAHNYTTSFLVPGENKSFDLATGRFQSKNATGGNVKIQALLRDGQTATRQTKFVSNDPVPSEIEPAQRFLSMISSGNQVPTANQFVQKTGLSAPFAWAA